MSDVSRETQNGERMNESQPPSHRPGSSVPSAASSYSVPVPSNNDSTPLAAAAQEHVSLMQRASAIERFDRPVDTRVFVVANQKGGVGKTTTTVNIAAALALKGLRVLVVDLDPQGNTSTALNIPHSEGTPGVYEAIVDGTDLGELVKPCPDIPGLTVLPATIDLAGAEIELVSLVARESRLDRALQSYLADREEADDRIDYVLIDCPPSLGLLTVNAMVAGREVLIPIQCEYYALEGLGQLVRNIDLIRAHLNPRLEVTTILLTMYDGRTRLSAGVAEEVRSYFGEKVITTPIPRSVRISEAPSYHQSVITYDKTSSGALSYLEAAREISVAGARGAAR
jgi:chromosome partitioning protein